MPGTETLLIGADAYQSGNMEVLSLAPRAMRGWHHCPSLTPMDEEIVAYMNFLKKKGQHGGEAMPPYAEHYLPAVASEAGTFVLAVAIPLAKGHPATWCHQPPWAANSSYPAIIEPVA